jgi:hypothetical protein
MPRWLKDMSAKKLAMVLVEDLNRQLRDPTGLAAGIVARIWGYILWAFVLYLLLFGAMGKSILGVVIWLVFDILYLLILEYIRSNWSRLFDKNWFRVTRILINLGFITSIIALSSNAKFILAIFYILPVFSAIVYFPEYSWAMLLVLGLSEIGLYVGGVWLAIPPKLTTFQFYLIFIGLLPLSYGLYRVPKTVISTIGQLTEIAGQLHKTLELQELLNKIVELSLQLTTAARALIIIIDPDHRNYIGHASDGFRIRTQESFTIQDVVERCFGPAMDQPFECPDLKASFDDGKIYAKYFINCNPSSILTEPLFRSDGKVIGVINVADNTPKLFSPVLRILMRDFSYLVSTAVENSLILRKIKLEEVREKSTNERLAIANNEKDIAIALVESSNQIIPNANRVILHRFISRSEILRPILVSEHGKLPPGWGNQKMLRRSIGI